MRPIALSEICRFRPAKFLPELVRGSDGARVFLLCLEPGQGLPPRADSEEVICHCLDGTASLTLGDETVPFSAGQLAVADPGLVRGIRAVERCTVLWVHIAASAGARRTDEEDES
ncbi:MAG: cupin domain-containing protein [Armatimonadota bacterium]